MKPLHPPKRWVCKCRHCRFTESEYRRSLKRGERQLAEREIDREVLA